MEGNYKEKIKERYNEGREAGRAERDGAYPMEFIYTKRALDHYINASKRVIEIGCGGGYYLMHYLFAINHRRDNYDYRNF